MTLDLRARRRTALWVAVALVVLAVGVVVAFGITPYPSPPAVAERPDPQVSARLAFVRFGARAPCLHVVDGRGDERELGCDERYSGDLRWVDDRHVAVRSYTDGARHVVDVETAEVTVDAQVATETLQPEPLAQATSADGHEARTGAGAGSVWVDVVAPDGAVTRVVEFDAPDGYDLYDARWSADGRWVAVLDSAQRVLVVDAAGRVPVRLWASDVGQFAVR